MEEYSCWLYRLLDWSQIDFSVSKDDCNTFGIQLLINNYSNMFEYTQGYIGKYHLLTVQCHNSQHRLCKTALPTYHPDDVGDPGVGHFRGHELWPLGQALPPLRQLVGVLGCYIAVS